MTDYNGYGTATTTGQGAGAGAALVWQNDSGAYTFAQTFTVDSSGLSAKGARWYLPSGSPSAPTSGYYIALYEVGNTTPVATAGPFTATVGAWNSADFSSPVALSAAPAEYRVAVLFPGGYYSAQTPNAVPWDPAGPINFPSTGTFNSGSSLTYPNSSSGSAPVYGIDVTVTDGGASGQDGTGSSASGSLSDSGSGTQTYSGSGSSASGALADSGAGTQVYSGSGSSASGSLSGSGTGATPLNGTGSSSSGTLSGSGAGTGPVAGATSTRMSRLLARLWFTESVDLERLAGDGAYGPTFASAATLRAAIDHGTKEVLTPTGDTAISTARVFLPVETDAVPLGSRVTLPDAHGGGTFLVIGSAVHLSGQATPNHLELSLL